MTDKLRLVGWLHSNGSSFYAKDQDTDTKPESLGPEWEPVFGLVDQAVRRS